MSTAGSGSAGWSVSYVRKAVRAAVDLQRSGSSPMISNITWYRISSSWSPMEVGSRNK